MCGCSQLKQTSDGDATMEEEDEGDLTVFRAVDRRCVQQIYRESVEGTPLLWVRSDLAEDLMRSLSPQLYIGDNLEAALEDGVSHKTAFLTRPRLPCSIKRELTHQLSLHSVRISTLKTGRIAYKWELPWSATVKSARMLVGGRRSPCNLRVLADTLRRQLALGITTGALELRAIAYVLSLTGKA